VVPGKVADPDAIGYCRYCCGATYEGESKYICADCKAIYHFLCEIHSGDSLHCDKFRKDKERQKRIRRFARRAARGLPLFD